MSALLFARGPISAIDLTSADKGSVLSLFLSKTMDLRATSRAASKCS